MVALSATAQRICSFHSSSVGPSFLEFSETSIPLVASFNLGQWRFSYLQSFVPFIVGQSSIPKPSERR